MTCSLALQGMNVVRLNMSHGDHSSHNAVVELVKEYNQMGKRTLAIMLDTKGPEVRSGDLAEPIEMHRGVQPLCTAAVSLLTCRSLCTISWLPLQCCCWRAQAHAPCLQYHLLQQHCRHDTAATPASHTLSVHRRQADVHD